MGLTLSFRQEAGYLVATVNGEYTLEAAKQGIESVANELAKRGQTRLLLDLRKFSVPRDNMTRYDTGVYWAQTFAPRVKTAFLYSPALYSNFPEDVAYNRGAQVAAFLQEADALTWLLKCPAPADTAAA